MQTRSAKDGLVNDGYLRHDVQFSGAYGGVVFRSLYDSFRPYLYRVVVLIVIGFAGRLAFLGSTWTVGVWVDSLAPARSHRSLPRFLDTFDSLDFVAAIAILALIGFFLNLVFRILFTRTGALSASRLYDVVTKHTSTLPQSFFDRTPVGRIISRFSSDYGAVLRMAGGPLAELLSISMDLILLIVLLSITHITLFPIVLITLALNFLVYRAYKIRLRDSRRENSLRRGPSVAHFAETSQGHASIRNFQKTHSFRNRFSELLNSYLESKFDAVRVVQSFSFAMVSSTASLLLVTGVVGLILHDRGFLSVGEFSVAFTYVLLLSSATQQFFDYIGRFDEALTGVERLGEYLDEPPELGVQPTRVVASSAKWNASSRSAAAFSGGTLGERSFQSFSGNPAVLVHDLSFSYSPHGPRILDGIDFSIAHGEKIGIIGRTGSGKSSLVSCLFHLYPIERGIVAVCNHLPSPLSDRHQLYQSELHSNLNILPLDSFRRQMALIAQDPVLFRGTLGENLKTSGHSSTSDELIEVLVQVGLGDWLTEVSRGDRSLHAALEFEISEGGLNLSAGQPQLVCVARALIQNSPVIVMDEATSFVDPRSEEALLKTTRELLKGKTQIVVAHRLSTLEDCDRILWLDQGRMRAIGCANEVLDEFYKVRR